MKKPNYFEMASYYIDELNKAKEAYDFLSCYSEVFVNNFFKMWGDLAEKWAVGSQTT